MTKLLFVRTLLRCIRAVGRKKISIVFMRFRRAARYTIRYDRNRTVYRQCSVLYRVFFLTTLLEFTVTCTHTTLNTLFLFSYGATAFCTRRVSAENQRQRNYRSPGPARTSVFNDRLAASHRAAAAAAADSSARTTCTQ